MKPCRECHREVSEQAFACPQCGAPYPAKAVWDGWGYEYKTKLFGLPLSHIAFKYRPNRMPVVARGVIAIGQFACGVICISQFGIGRSASANSPPPASPSLKSAWLIR